MKRILSLFAFLFIPAAFCAASGPYYFGLGGSLSKAQSKIRTTGSLTNVLQVMSPEFFPFSSQPDIEPIGLPPDFFVESSNILGVSSWTPSAKGMVGYRLFAAPHYSIDFQIDAEAGSGRAESSIQTSNSTTFVDNTFLSSSFKISERNEQSFGVSFIPQWHLNFRPYAHRLQEVSLLVLAGYRYGAFNTLLDAFSPFSSPVHIKSRTWRHGMEIGLGAETALSKQWALRFIASQTYYNKQPLFQGTVFSNWGASSKSRIDGAFLGLLWYA